MEKRHIDKHIKVNSFEKKILEFLADYEFRTLNDEIVFLAFNRFCALCFQNESLLNKLTDNEQAFILSYRLKSQIEKEKIKHISKLTNEINKNK